MRTSNKSFKRSINNDVSLIIQIFIDDCDWPGEVKNKLHDRQAIFKSGCSEREFTGRIRDGLRHFDCALGRPRGFDVRNLGDSVEIKKFNPTEYLHIVVPKTFFDDQLPVTQIGVEAFSDMVMFLVMQPPINLVYSNDYLNEKNKLPPNIQGGFQCIRQNQLIR